MALLNGFNAEEHDELTDFSPLPQGDYLAIATDSDMKSTKAGTGEYLEIAWEVIDGEFKGRRLWSRLNLDNPNPKAVEIAQRELSSICRAVGVLRPEDSSQLHNIPLVLRVGVEKRKDTGEFSNRVKGYANANGARASYSGSNGHPGSSNPSTPPWKR